MVSKNREHRPREPRKEAVRRVLEQSPQSLPLPEIVLETGLPKATAHRHLEELVDRGELSRITFESTDRIVLYEFS